MTLHICVQHLCRLFTSTASYSKEFYIWWEKHLFFPVGTEQLLVFSMLFMLMLEEAKNCHLLATFSMPLRALKTSVRSLFSHLLSTYIPGWWVLSDFSASCTEAVPLTLPQTFPVSFINSETGTWYWNETHQGLHQELMKCSQSTLFTSLSLFPVWPFLTGHLLLWLLLSQSWGVYLRTCSSLEISSVISQNRPFIFILCWLPFKQLFTHGRTEVGDRLSEAF